MPRLKCVKETYQSVSKDGIRRVQRHFVPGDYVDWPDDVPLPPKTLFIPVDMTEVPLSVDEVERIRKALKKVDGKDEPAPAGPGKDLKHRPGYAALAAKRKVELEGEAARLGIRLQDLEKFTKDELITRILDARSKGADQEEGQE